MELNKIYNMDCTIGLSQIKDKSVDLILTDPPYGINYLSNHYKNGNPHKKIIRDETLNLPLNDMWRLLKPTGSMFIFYSHKKPIVDDRIKNIIIWVKNNWTAGDLYSDYGNQYECIAFMPQEQFKLRFKRYSNVWLFDRVPPTKLKHPTQKPLELIRRIIHSTTNKGDLVLDPFMGSGTTAVASKQLNRNFLGFEIDKNYFKIINQRLAQKNLIEIFE